MAADFQSVMPLIPTGGTLPEALEYFTQKLGFSVESRWETGAVVSRGTVSFLLVPNNNREWAQNASFSIGVTDLDAVHHEFQSRGIPMGPLDVKVWGRREFHMIVPSGVCLQFFQQD